MLFVHTMNIILITLEVRESAATCILFLSIEKGDDMLTAIFLGSKNFKDDEMFYIKTRPFSSHNSKLVLSHKNRIFYLFNHPLLPFILHTGPLAKNAYERGSPLPCAM